METASIVPSPGHLQVLVVDDEPDLCELASMWLESLDHGAVVACSAAEALEQLRAQRFDVLLTDMVMPGGIDGIELAREAVRRQPALKVVVASGYTWRAAEVLAIPAIPLEKPYRKADLAAALALAMAG